MEDNDAQLQLKKRARRRLVGAVAFAGLAAVALPMIMDHEPKQVAQDVEIRIPGQDEKPFAPKFSTAPAAAKSAVTSPEAKSVEKPAEKAPEKAQEKTPEKAAEKAAEKPAAPAAEKAPEKAAGKPAEKTPVKAEKPAEKIPEKPSKANGAEAQRAAAILAGKSPDAGAGGQYVILIGAFSNQANVKNLQTKLADLGIKVYTEPLETPQGKKTRVRAGPFPSRDAGDKALEKMKRIGVAGVLAAKQ